MAEWGVPGYTTIKRLGAGGFGEVVLARHEATGTLVAVKYLRAGLLADAGFREMFRAEAQVLASLADPNIVRLYEYAESASGAAIIMELIDGVSLRDILARHGATTPEAALVVLQGSLAGLATAHARSVVHRDYKPENVLINAAGASKLTDFGIAARAGDHPIPAGTLAYAAPEQLTGAAATPASDVYAATATFYECLTGHPPFTGDAIRLMYQHSFEPVPLDPVPEPLRPLITAGMAKNPRSRPADAAGLASDLRQAATSGYGPGWDERGRSHLGEAALLLAALWPSAAAPAIHAAHAAPVIHQVSLLRRIGRRLPRLRHASVHLTPVKAVIAAGVTGAVITGGVVAAATLTHHPKPPAQTTAVSRPGQILFMTTRPHGFWNIHEIHPDGTGARLLPIGSHISGWSPALSPDGTKVVSAGEGMLDVNYLNGRPANGTWRHYPLDSQRGDFFDPVWSPSGRQIAFIYAPGPGFGEIDVINADGTGRHRVLQASEISLPDAVNGFLEPSLAWSPDGARLAFATTPVVPTGSVTQIPMGTIAVVPVSGGPVRTLVTNIPGGATGLSWAPGPQPLFIDGHQPGIWEATGHGGALGHGGAKVVLPSGTYPSWAPDGVRFAAAQPGKGVIVATVTGKVQATIGPADVAYVQWGGGTARAATPPPARSPSPSGSSSSPSPTASPATALTQFKVCADPTSGCRSQSFGALNEMMTEPAQLITSGDGSVYVKHLTWSAWSSATARGIGLLELDNCKPSCAQGTFTGYPATVTLSGLTGYGNGEHAYSTMVISAPSAPAGLPSYVIGPFTTGLVP